MARVKKNLITKGLSGEVGGTLVFRVVGDETIVSSSPSPAQGEPTEAQLQQRERFQRAIVYARGQIADPALKARYEKKARKNQSGFNAAVTDFFSAPEITGIDLSAYTGAIGNTIRVTAIDDFDVNEVSVDILNQDGSLVESGKALREAASTVYVYTATAANASLTGDKLVIKATDLAGNLTTVERVL